MSFTDVWDATFETKPDNNTYGYQIDDYIRRVQTGVRERMDVDHFWNLDDDEGYHGLHRRCMLLATTKPTITNDVTDGHYFGCLYAKAVATGIVEAFFEDESGNEIQLTNRGVLNVASTDANQWKLVASDKYTSTPASTSTLTMVEDLTASVLVGMPLRYTIGGVEYFGQVTAITDELLTVRGAPLSGDVSNLKYGGGHITEIAIPVNGEYEDASNTALLTSDNKSPLLWTKEKSYVVGYKVWSRLHDTGAHGKASVRVNNTEVNTTAGGLDVAADATWYSTVVDISVSAYDVNYGEAIEATCVKGGNGDAEDLCILVTIVTP